MPINHVAKWKRIILNHSGLCVEINAGKPFQHLFRKRKLFKNLYVFCSSLLYLLTSSLRPMSNALKRAGRDFYDRRDRCIHFFCIFASKGSTHSNV